MGTCAVQIKCLLDFYIQINMMLYESPAGTSTAKGFHWVKFFSEIHQLIEEYQVPGRPEGNAFSLIAQLNFTHFFNEMHSVFDDLITNTPDTFQQV